MTEERRVITVSKDVCVDVDVDLAELASPDLFAELRRRKWGPMLSPVNAEFNHDQFIENLYQAVLFGDRDKQDRLVRELLLEVGDKIV